MIDRHLFELAGAKSIAKRLAGLNVLQAVLIIGQALSLSWVLTMLWQGHQLDVLMLIVFMACFIGRQALNWLSEHWLDNYAARSSEQLRQQLLNKVFELGPALVQKQGTGSTITMILDGIAEVRDYIKLTFTKVMTMMIVPVLILIALAVLDWRSALILLVMYPLIVLFMVILGRAAQAKAIKQFGNFQKLSNNFIDSLRGIATLKYFGLSKRYSRSIFRSSELFRHRTMRVLKIAMLSTFALDFFTTLSIAVIAVFLGFDLINGRITLFPALGILILAPEYFLPIRNFAGDFHATLNGKNAFAKARQLIAQPIPQSADLSLQPWTNDDEFDIHQLAFQYPHGMKLEPFSLHLKGYQKVGIIGMSGSGKTTLINLLSGFLTPASGKVSLSGQESTTLNIPAWHQQITYIPQTPYVFTTSLRANIAFYTPDVTDEQIRAAIHVVGLDDLLDALPDDLDTVIGAGKRALSGGQAQRIALARAFLDQKRKVMFFDEPTAHLDIETELDLKKRMLPLMKNHLVFFATHRLHWMAQMDYILVMDHGRLVEQGTYDELAVKQGAFTKLIERMRGDNDVQ